MLNAQQLPQETTPPAGNIKRGQFYLQKSRNQRVGRLVMLGGGICMMLVEMANAVSDMDFRFSLYGSQPAGGSEKSGGGLFFAGGAAVPGSVPLFVAAGRNKQKARLAALQPTTQVTPKFHLRQTTLAIVIPLRRQLRIIRLPVSTFAAL